MHLSPVPILLILLAAAPTVAPTAARAGAWTLAPGEGQLIFSSGKRTAPIAAMFEGLPEEDTSDLRVHLEYGLLDGLTLGASASAEYATHTAEIDVRLGGHVRYRLWQSPSGGVYSVQAGGAVPVNDWIGNPLGIRHARTGPEAEVRLLYGRSWLGDSGNTFVGAEAAYRWYGGASDEIRVDATVGHAFSRRFMVIGAAWARIPLDGGPASLKLAPSVAWTLWPSLGPNDKKPAEIAPPRTLQFGLSWDALNPDDGIGFTLSIWNRF